MLLSNREVKVKIITILRIAAYLSLGLSVFPLAFFAATYPEPIAISVGAVIAAAWPTAAVLALISLVGLHFMGERLKEKKMLAVSSLLIICVCSLVLGLEIKRHAQYETHSQTTAMKTQNETKHQIIIAHNSTLKPSSN